MYGEAFTLTHNFEIIAVTIQWISIFMGVCFTLGGLMQLKKLSESRSMMSSQGSAAGPLLMLLAGAMLMILPKVIGLALLSFFGQNSPMSYGGSGGSSSLTRPILMFVRIIGVGSFIRGIVMMARAGGQQSQPGTLGKAIVHMFAGILCVNIVGTLSILKDILGFT
ncbi:MAG: type IV secretion protein IcmC [Gammaproteobacteria bacterium]|nr:type IV secretion protein IcmC [Gammaproteobacteria bacterium]